MSWLDRIDVASPCPESWEGMAGDERQRHCDRCEQHVYDLSGLTQVEAEALVQRSAGGEEVCVRFLRRADGTVLTADCPARLAEGRRSGWRRAAAALLALCGVGLAEGCEEQHQVVGKMEVCPPSPQQQLQGGDAAPLDTRVSARPLPRAGGQRG